MKYPFFFTLWTASHNHHGCADILSTEGQLYHLAGFVHAPNMTNAVCQMLVMWPDATDYSVVQSTDNVTLRSLYL